MGRDLGLGTLTLPAIHLLRGLAGEERAEAESVIQNAIQGQSQHQIRELLRQRGADASAYTVAQDRVDRAKGLLETLDPGPWRDVLTDLADASIDRDF